MALPTGKKGRLLDFLRARGVASAGEAADTLGLLTPSVRRDLQELAASGLAVRESKGVYRIAGREEAMAALASILGPDWDHDVQYRGNHEVGIVEFVGQPGPGAPTHHDVAVAMEEWRSTDVYQVTIVDERRVHVTANIFDVTEGLMDGMPFSFALSGDVAIGQAGAAMESAFQAYEDTTYGSIEVAFLS